MSDADAAANAKKQRYAELHKRAQKQFQDLIATTAEMRSIYPQHEYAAKKLPCYACNSKDCWGGNCPARNKLYA